MANGEIVVPVEVLPNGSFLYRDKHNPNCGWIVEERVIDGSRQIVPLDYVRRPR